ncbi:hypothetical protein M0804_003815 [Polistes exclamans]|nr:hypothetical protein M0804_003815 [Polistes exclamans]
MGSTFRYVTFPFSSSASLSSDWRSTTAATVTTTAATITTTTSHHPEQPLLFRKITKEPGQGILLCIPVLESTRLRWLLLPRGIRNESLNAPSTLELISPDDRGRTVHTRVNSSNVAFYVSIIYALKCQKENVLGTLR